MARSQHILILLLITAAHTLQSEQDVMIVESESIEEKPCVNSVRQPRADNSPTGILRDAVADITNTANPPLVGQTLFSNIAHTLPTDAGVGPLTTLGVIFPALSSFLNWGTLLPPPSPFLLSPGLDPLPSASNVMLLLSEEQQGKQAGTMKRSTPVFENFMRRVRQNDGTDATVVAPTLQQTFSDAMQAISPDQILAQALDPQQNLFRSISTGDFGNIPTQALQQAQDLLQHAFPDQLRLSPSVFSEIVCGLI